jgi:hypothetical protein
MTLKSIAPDGAPTGTTKRSLSVGAAEAAMLSGRAARGIGTKVPPAGYKSRSARVLIFTKSPLLLASPAPLVFAASGRFEQVLDVMPASAGIHGKERFPLSREDGLPRRSFTPGKIHA